MSAITTNTNTSYIGKQVDKVDAVERVIGKAMFGADIHLPGMLHGKVLRSPHPHAWIKHIDTAKALALMGVKAVVTVTDLPPLPSAEDGVIARLTSLRKMTIAHDKALYDGHAIAAVAATTPDIAEAALELIQVEYDPLPPVERAIDGMKPDAPLLHDDLYTNSPDGLSSHPSNVATYLDFTRGDIEDGFAQADLVHETTYETKMVHQGYIEPNTATAWAQADGKVTIWTATQGTFGVRGGVSQTLNKPLNRINVIPMEVGGGFGGKESSLLETLAVLLSEKSGRPVKMVMSRAEVFRATGPAAPLYAVIKTGTKKDGTLTACYAKLVVDAGAFPGGPVVRASQLCFGQYKMDNVTVEAYDVVTNKPRVQPYRAPGGTSTAFAVDSHMDEVAEKLGIDPLEFRLINVAEEGDQLSDSQVINRIGMKDILTRISQHPCWTVPLEKGNYRGRGMATGLWPAGGNLTSSGTVFVHPDGTVTLSTGQVDLTGTRTTLRQIVADVMQVPIENVDARVGDTASTSYTDLTAGSRTVYSLGTAVRLACQDALSQLKAHAADHFQVPAEEIEYQASTFWVQDNPAQIVDLVTIAQNSTKRSTGPICGYSTVTSLPLAPQCAAHVVDVEVDPDTGKVTILRCTAFQDVGRSINPLQVEGQIQGGTAQALGWALNEYYHYDKGVMLNPTFLDYRVPTSVDLPMIDTETIEVPATEGPYGARGVGEGTMLPPAAALANAIYQATATRMYTLPMTPENVLWAVKNNTLEPGK